MRNKQHNVKEVSEITGLSDEAIYILKGCKRVERLPWLSEPLGAAVSRLILDYYKTGESSVLSALDRYLKATDGAKSDAMILVGSAAGHLEA